MNQDLFQAPTLVLGGTGKTGGRLARRLTGMGVPVRIGSRTAGVPFDWENPGTWGPALDGARAVYIAYQPDVAAPGATEAIGELTALAVDRRVRHLVLLSGRGEPEAQACEKVLASTCDEAGVAWTVLRCNWFNQNFSEGYLLQPVLDGQVALPVGEVGEPFLDVDDIAEVAAAVLTRAGPDGQVYELSGPRPLTFAEAVGTIAAATGRDIRFVRVTPEEYAAAMAAAGAPADVVDLVTYLFTTVLDGRNTRPADGVQRMLQRPPRDFTAYARDTAATGIWNPGTGGAR
jgi:uncharacterized protein YbjT (DUF2867 family)